MDYTKTDGKMEDVLYLMDIIESDPVSSLRHALCRLIVSALSEKSVSGSKTKKEQSGSLSTICFCHFR